MNKLAIIALVLVATSCYVEAEDNAFDKCGKQLVELEADIPVPEELEEAEQSISERVNGGKSNRFFKSKNKGNRFEREYFESLDSDHQKQLSDACSKFVSDTHDKISHLVCEDGWLNKLVNVDGKMDWSPFYSKVNLNPKSHIDRYFWYDTTVDQFNRLHKVALVIKNKAW